ncbi:Lactation elevated protein 1 [Hordeum vulgare]|nr:Lactation elevated protein 1 [Hordeum vulgare]
MPFNDAAPPASEVFDEMAGSGGSSNATTEFVNMLDKDEDDDGSRNLHKPDGDKKTKEKMKREKEAASLREMIDAMVQSNELMLLKSLEIKKELAQKKAKEKQENGKCSRKRGSAKLPLMREKHAPLKTNRCHCCSPRRTRSCQ